MPAHSNASAATVATPIQRPSKPFDGFPLYAHPLGYWSKKIAGTIVHFGRWGRIQKKKMVALPYEPAWKEALESYRKHESDARSGALDGVVVMRDDDRALPGEVDINRVCNDFYNHKLQLRNAGKLRISSMDSYKSITIKFQLSTLLSVLGPSPTSFVQVHTSATHSSFQNIIDQKGVVQLWGYGHDSEEPYEPVYEVAGFDTWEFVEVSEGFDRFVATFHVDVPYDEIHSGYFWGVGVGASAYAYGDGGRTAASANVVHGVGIVDIFATGGGVLPGLTSDSGLLFTAPVAGDFDLDGDIDGYDFLAWQRGESPNPLSAGDLADWQANYGATSLSAISAVPEPSTIIITCMCLVGLLSRARQN